MKSYLYYSGIVFFFIYFFIGDLYAQTTVFSDNFSTNTSTTWTTSGQIGSSSFFVNRSGDDWGARRNSSPQQLELTNDASATANVNGWVFANVATTGFSSPYNTTLSSNTGMVSWYFNIRQIRPDPAGFSSGSYGVAFILATSSQTANNTGTGYAVVYGQTNEIDPVRLVKYSGGLSTGLTNIITSNTTGLTDFGTEYLSCRVTYNPTNNQWELFLRNDGASAFADPISGTLTSQGTATDNTYTSTSLGFMGAYWQGSTAANQTAFFDNVTVQVSPASTPTIQATNIIFSGISHNQMTLNWSNGDGAKRIVKMNTSNSFTIPGNGTDPTANTLYSGSGEQVVFNGNQNTVTITGLNPSTTYWYRIYEYNGTGAETSYLTSTGIGNPLSQTTNAPPPVISVSTVSLSGFSYQLGSGPSTAQNFNVSGNNLTGNITITESANFEISQTESSGYVSPIILTPTGGNVSQTTIYVRLKSGRTAGHYQGEQIGITTPGATDQTVTVSGTVTSTSAFLRTKATGLWTDVNIWESSENGTEWSNALFAPASTDGNITILNGHVVSIAASISIDQIVVEAGGQLNINTGQTLTLLNGTGTDLTINGTLLNQGTFTLGSGATWAVNNGGTFIHNTTSGISSQLSSATLGHNSTFIYRNSSTPSFSNRVFGNLSIESTSGTFTTTVTGGGNLTVYGDYIIGSNVNLTNKVSGTQNYYGNFSINGTLNDSTGVNIFHGNAKVIGGTSAIRLQRATINAAISVDTDLNVNVELRITQGTLTIGSGRKVTAQHIVNEVGSSGIFITGSSETQPNGTLIFHNAEENTVAGTVQMYSKAAASTFNAQTGAYSNYKWQFFGVPLRSVAANPTFSGSFLRRYDESVSSGSSQWISLNNTSVLESFNPYQITQRVARNVIFSGILENRSKTIQLSYTSNGNYPGQNLIANPYQASLDITKLTFGSATEETIYLYNTGSYADWNAASGFGENPGQYTAIPKNIANPTIPGGLPGEIPSMQGFLVRKLVQDNTNLENFNLSINYQQAVTKSTRPQRAKKNDLNEVACLVVQASSSGNFDKLWIYEVPGCSRDFDNGWDGRKMGGPANAPLIYAEETSGIYQVNSIDNFNDSWLTFKAGAEAHYKLSFSYFNISKYAGFKFYLTDTKTGETIEITENGTEYSFTAEPHTTQSKRFRINTLYNPDTPDSSIWTGTISNEWNQAGNWSNGVPGTNTHIIVSQVNNYPIISSQVTCASLTIQPNSKLTINNNNTLSVLGNLIIESNEEGTATLVNNGTLIVNGTTTMQQYLASDRNWYISSPFNNAIAPAGFGYFEYREPGDNVNFVSPASAYWKTLTSGVILEAGKGYIVNPEQAPVTFNLSGTLNSEPLEVQLTRTAGKSNTGFNLVGNPYPSYLSISNIMTNPNLDKSIWMRGRNAGNSAWIFDSYNIAGAVSTRNSGLAVTGKIPPMQAFWVRVSSGKTVATLHLNNTMRSHKDVANNKFRAPANLNSLVRLLVSNGTNSDETVIYFNANASNGFDAYDSHKMFNNNPNIPEIYTKAGSEKLVINGMTQYFGGLQIPLGFITGQSNTLSIRANDINNFNPEIQIILKDRLFNTEFNLTQGAAYNFTSEATNTEERFVLIFASTNSTWTGTTSVDWYSNDNWSHGTPASVTNTIIAEAINQPVINGITSTAELTLNANTQLTINSIGILNIAGNFILKSNDGGTATLVNEGSLTVAGATTMQQYLSSERNWYMSSPLSDGTLPTGFISYEYREPGNNTGFTAPATAFWKSVIPGDDLEVAKGYIVKPQAAPTTLSLTGTLNNGTLNPVTLTRTTGRDKEGFNLLGNPYPSYLNVSSILNNAEMEKSFWYRTRNAGNTHWTFDTYNLQGSVGTANSGKTISDKIPPMQAFWVRVASGKSKATLSFNNAMRVHQDNSNNKFRISPKPNPLIRLLISNGINSDETVIYFNENASDNYDTYDSPKMFNSSPSVPEIYSIAGNEKLVINGLSRPYAGLQLPLGFLTGQTNNFSIRVVEYRNFNSDLQLVLKDNELKTEFELSSDKSYNFSSNAINTLDRFMLIFKSSGGNTGLTDEVLNAVFVSSFERKLRLQINAEINNAEVKIFNVSGKLIHSQTIANRTTLLNKTLEEGVYVVKVLNNGRITVLRTVIN